jgi:hypothetical protein
MLPFGSWARNSWLTKVSEGMKEKDMTKKLTVLAISLCLLFTTSAALVYPALAQSQNPIAVTNSSVEANYPTSLTFSCQAQGDVNITDVWLEYQVEQISFAVVTAEAKTSFNPSPSIKADYTLDMQQYGQIPQGTDIDYWWLVKDAAGDILQSTTYHYVVVDNQHTWSTMNQGKITLFWYGQSQSFGSTVMAEAQSALSTLASDTGATPNRAVNISVYTSSQDYAASVLGAPEWAGGEELSQYDAVFILVRPGQLSLDLPGIAHELTHVIIGQITSNPYNYIPFWLNEGLAVHVQFPQGKLPSQFTTALSNAFANNSLISVRSLSDPFSAYPDKAYLSYAESASVVAYLIAQYGAATMEQFLTTFQQGSTYDGALQANYGFDMDGLFSQWQAWVNSQNEKHQPIY